MSEHQLMIQKKNDQRNEQEDEDYGLPIIDVFEADRLNQLAIDQSLRDNYKSLDFPCCGDYLEPNIRPIAQKKKEKGKKFYDQINRQIVQQNKTLHYDGLFDSSQLEEISQKEQVRLKSRIIRDLREEYYQQNSQFIFDNEFYHNHLSRLANISSQSNDSLSTLQKNAILSQRNNQKKSMPFQLEINIGFIWISKHDLQNNQQRKFQQLRPLLNRFSNQSAYPTLAEISKQIQYLKKTKQRMDRSDASNEELDEIQNKIKLSSQVYKEQVTKLEEVMQSIIRKWREVKEQRRNSGLETVPWKLNIKQYEIDGQRSFDIGVVSSQINEKPNGANANDQLRRRQNIRDERYMIKIYINGNQVAKSEKVNLQWPSWRIPINSKFSVTVYSAPSSIQVQIIKVGIINHTVDTINLILPGVNSKTITASQRRFAGANFSINGSKARRKQQQAASPAGMLVYRIQWKGQGSRMPPVSFKAQQQETAPTQASQQVNLDYVKLYDIMDPRIHQRSKREKVEDEIIKTQGALLPFIDTQSARHLFLKMKATQPQFEKLQVPLTEEQIQKRPDLLAVLQRQKSKTLNDARIVSQQIYNPAEGVFKMQDKQILDEIKKILYQIQSLKINMLKGNSSAKYKITEEIIKQYVFQQMQSPIVVFFKNLFTQKRKLGPIVTYYLQAKNVRDVMEVNIHFRSAKNVPLRNEALQKLKIQQQRGGFNEEQYRALQMNRGMYTGNAEMYTNYAMGFYRGPPHMNMQGGKFFIPGRPLQNMNFQVHYPRQKIERNNTCIIMNFKKLVKKTQTLQGSFPEWNQTIQFEYNLNSQQMTIAKLYSNNEKLIKLFLFDIREQSKSTTAVAEKRIKKSKFYLGRIDIPMSMMVAIPSLAGIFPIQRPFIIFGYGIKKMTGFDMKRMDDQVIKTQHPNVLTMVNIDMFSDPLIDSMIAYNEDRKFVTGAHKQSTMFLQRASDWLSDLNSKIYIRLWLNNIQGRSVFICKFLSDFIMPPQELENSIQRCARFVSLIPRKYNCRLLQNTEQFHLTCDQMLRIKMGEDHGILLCNFFNYVDKKANRNNVSSSLIVGKAFPYGKSIFVLRRNNDTGDSQIWDPYAGRCYFMPAKIYDTYCCIFKYPQKKQLEDHKDFCCMLQIGSIVTSANVYVNIQDSLKPEDLDFNINDEKLWKPFLTERMRTQYFEHSIIESIQPQIDIDFYPKPKQIQSSLQKQLQKFILKKMQSQRLNHFKNYTLKQNTSIASLIYNKLLLKCQNFLMDFRTTGIQSSLYDSSKRMQFTKGLQQIQAEKIKINESVDSDKMLFGFTLNMAYTTKQQIWEKVQQTHIHLDEEQNLEFSVVVKCFEIACNLISVWIFVGSISLI